MADIDSTPDQPPYFGPELPLYPGVFDTIRIAPGTTPLSGNIYAAFIQQFDQTALAFRDRVACYLKEANGSALAAGYYNAQLVGSNLTLPLYVTFCCPSPLLL